MAKFKDGKNREWVVTIDVFLLERVAERIDGLRLDKLLANKSQGLLDLFEDALKFVRVLWVLVEEEAEKKEVTPEQFGRALAGDALESAAAAFMEALADFCPSRQRKIVRAMAAKGAEVADLGTARTLAALDKIDPEAVLEEIAARTSSGSATNSPASSGSTPAPGG